MLSSLFSFEKSRNRMPTPLLNHCLCHRYSSGIFLLLPAFKNCNPPTPVARLPRLSSRVFLSCYTTASATNMSVLQSDGEDELEKGESDGGVDKFRVLMEKMEAHGISCDGGSWVPGRYHCSLCPKCRGGKSMERSLSVHIVQDVDFALWRCYRIDCGWAGQAFPDSRVTIDGVNKIFKSKSSREVTAEGMVLEPLSDELIAYFAQRMISERTLQRNGVMQMAGHRAVIAFTYRQNGRIVGCKYRALEKKYWQDSGTQKWLYGLDDINEASEVIIVEGEIDKLAVEEAGFRNCVSVPGGAPQQVSSKSLPLLEKDKAYQYLWNCKTYLDKVSRIVLATDDDHCGRALAEELALRLGTERCWVVRWPKKDDLHHFKDANEVLKCLGPSALKEVIETAESYQQSDLATEDINSSKN